MQKLGALLGHSCSP